MAQFEELLKKLQAVIKDGHKEGAYDEAMKIAAELQAFSGAQAQVAYIVNISDQRFQIPRTYYNIWVHSCEPDEEFHLTEVTSVIDHMDMGLGTTGEFNPATGKRAQLRTVPIPFSAEMIANDVCQQVNGNISDGAFVGVFMSLTPKPRRDVLADAKKRFRKFNEELVYKGDMAWALKSDYRMIPDSARRALAYIGQERDWYAPITPDYVDCPACHSKIRPGLVKCPQAGCGAILDVDKAIEFGISVPETMMQAHLEKQTRPKQKGA